MLMHARIRLFSLALSAVFLASLVADLGIGGTAADAGASPRQSVRLELSAGECTVAETESGRVLTTQVGAVVVGQPDALTVLDGKLTLNIKGARSGRDKRNGKPRSLMGTWTLEPDGSPSALSGRFGGRRSSDGAKLNLSGRGRDALRNVSIKSFSMVLPDIGDLCGDGPAFTDGKAGVVYRRAIAPRGAVLVRSANSFDDTIEGLRTALDNNPNLNIVREVDHSAGAATRSIQLAPTFEFFFGNPAIGSPLMQNANRPAGIDLPQKMIIWQDLYGDVYLAYNAPSYLQSRHQITDSAEPQLQTVSGALANLASTATDTTVPPTFDAGRVGAGRGLVVTDSTQTVDRASEAIIAALTNAPPVNVVFTLDHQANASTVNVELPPTTVIVFGNPSLGSILMQADQSVALDLPQKMLVFENGSGGVSVAYNDPAWLARRHGLRRSGPEVEAVLTTLEGALANFAGSGA